jgi:LysR family transcriptional regulator, nitrogen assimilation regulatory protein
MELRQIIYFKLVAECGSFARASEKLRVAQPAISNQISKLEARLGTKLFIRHARGIQLTESGRVFLTHAAKILACIDDARLAIRELASEPTGAITIGMPTTVAMVLAGPLLERVKRQFPMIDLQVVEALSGEISQWHAAGRFDLSVLYLPPGRLLPNALPLMKEDLYLLGPADAARKHETTIRFADLSELPLYHTSRTHACRLLLDDAAERAGIKLNYVAEIDSIPLLYEFVSGKNGFSIFPCCFPPAVPVKNVAYRRITDPDLHLRSYIARGINRPTSRGQTAVLELLRTLAAQVLDEASDFGTRTPAYAA